MKAIETEYRGYKFRSRLEARWAVFFDALGIKWEYEPEGFEFKDGTKYLPDFYLPGYDSKKGVYCEVKPSKDSDFSKARMLAKESMIPVLLCEGNPDFKVLILVDEDAEGDATEINVIPNADAAEGENRFFGWPGYEDEDGTIPEDMIDLLGETYISAVYAARQARFEFGEKGKV